MRSIFSPEGAGWQGGFEFERFLSAQESVYVRVLEELRAGQRRTDWMWFIFPKMRGIDSSPLAQHFGLRSLAEAASYLEHPLLGSRLEECVRLTNKIDSTTAYQIFGSPDDRNFQASMTLFRCASQAPALYQQALLRFFDGESDPLTLAMLR